jgi:phytanoyl-CoA hydroxylase
MSVTADDIRFFVEEGYLVVRGLVSAEDVELARRDAELFASGEYAVSNPPADGQILCVHFPHWVSPVAKALVHHEGVVDVVSSVAGAHLPFWDGRSKCMQSMLFLKPPGLQGQAWHQDERYIPTRDRSLLGAWIALDDATLENGCLWVIPGSHRSGGIYPTREHSRPDEFDASDEAYGFDDTTAVPVEVNTGDVVFFNGYLLHRSTRNRSAGTRRALVNHYMNAWSPLPWMASKGIEIGVEDFRVVDIVRGPDPYPWKELQPSPTTTFVRPRAAIPADNGDRLHIDTSMVVYAPIEMVWRVLTDFASYGYWNATMSLDGVAADGSVVTVTTRPLEGDPLTYDITVESLDVPKQMVWSGGLPDRSQFAGDHRWELLADGAATFVRHHEHFSGSLAEGILSTRGATIRADFERFNASLRFEAERRSAALR